LLIFLLTVLFSALYLHSSSVIMLILPLIQLATRVIKNFWIFVLLIFCSSIIFIGILHFMATNYFPEYEVYLNTSGQKNTGRIMQIYNLALLIIMLLISKNIVGFANSRFYLIIYIIGASISIVSIFIIGGGVNGPVRVSYYFSIFLLFLIPIILQAFSTKLKKRIRWLYSLLMICLFISYIYQIRDTQLESYTSKYIPYKTIFLAPK
jgi:hypothetical protein